MQLTKFHLQSRNVVKIFKFRSGFNRYSAVPRCNQLHTICHSRMLTCNVPKFEIGNCEIRYSSTAAPLVDYVTYEKVCEETLQSLSDYFEQLVEEVDKFKSADISYSSGVLTINLGENHGTYVINRQSPNRQIWLSSPTSGPKRYDFAVEEQCWIYRHTGESLHRLLQNELSKIVGKDVDLSELSYAKV